MGAQHDLIVNGERRRVDADPQTPLLYVLRDDLGLRGTRYGCGEGLCGSCTILIDGIARQSCQVPVSSLQGAAITTIEGVGSKDNLHAVQQAVLRHQAAQCGYCLSGIIMSAVPLMASDQAPSRQAVRAALEPNLCRCGAHVRILDAVEEAWRQVAAGS